MIYSSKARRSVAVPDTLPWASCARCDPIVEDTSVSIVEILCRWAIFLTEVSLFPSHNDTPRMERRHRITKLCRRRTQGSRITALSRPYRRQERTTDRDEDARLGRRFDLSLVPKNAVDRVTRVTDQMLWADISTSKVQLLETRLLR